MRCMSHLNIHLFASTNHTVVVVKLDKIFILQVALLRIAMLPNIAHALEPLKFFTNVRSNIENKNTIKIEF